MHSHQCDSEFRADLAEREPTDIKDLLKSKWEKGKIVIALQVSNDLDVESKLFQRWAKHFERNCWHAGSRFRRYAALKGTISTVVRRFRRLLPIWLCPVRIRDSGSGNSFSFFMSYGFLPSNGFLNPGLLLLLESGEILSQFLECQI
jgi:hypothetical protein